MDEVRDSVRSYPEDFDDVFGGPPRSVLSRQYSVEYDIARSNGFVFEDMFRKPESKRADRTLLPEFRIPVGKPEEFYSDIFGTSRSKSQTNSNSTVLSSEEWSVSPVRPQVGGDDDVRWSSFGANIRPTNLSSKWNTTKKMQTDSPCNTYSFESDFTHKYKGCYTEFPQKVSSPEIIAFGPNSYTSVKESIEDLQVNSPASIASFNQDQGDDTSTLYEEDGEIMGSFVIEINPGKSRERVGESVGVDEAIAWAKLKCQTCDLEKEGNKREDEEQGCHGLEEMNGVIYVPEVHVNDSRESSALDKEKVCTTEEPLQEPEEDASLCKQMELELLDEDIKLWSEGKESNIRLLLATLHHILWPSSGWVMIPLTNLKDNANVKKAYQKARLYLHPDKLQQRGATGSQKFVAEIAFPILQDAWAAFISQDVLFSIS